MASLSGRKVLALALGAGLVLSMAACSGSSDDAASSTSKAAPSTSAAVDPASIAAKPSPGCSSATTAPKDTAAGKFTATSGQAGMYIQTVPTDIDAKTPTPVVFNMHGLGSPASIQELISGLGAYGKAHGFMTVAPALTEEGSPRWDLSEGSQDLAWITELITHVEATHCIDEARVYMAGLSMGAAVTSSMVCTLSDRIAAVALIAGMQTPAWCNPPKPAPVITFHGTSDPFIPFAGAAHRVLSPNGKPAALPGIAADGTVIGTKDKLSMFSDQPVPEIVQTWAKRNGCETTPKDTSVASDVILHSYPCPANAAVEFYEITGGGHTWPGDSSDVMPVALTGKTIQSIKADDLLWKFFQAHPLPAA